MAGHSGIDKEILGIFVPNDLGCRLRVHVGFQGLRGKEVCAQGIIKFLQRMIPGRETVSLLPCDIACQDKFDMQAMQLVPIDSEVITNGVASHIILLFVLRQKHLCTHKVALVPDRQTPCAKYLHDIVRYSP